MFSSKSNYQEYSQHTPTEFNDALKTIKGRIDMTSQYHMHMEPQTTVCIPSEDGMLVYTSTQYPNLVHIAISECLLLPANSIHIVVNRVGGGYGGKISRSSQIACACALACHLTGYPVRFVMSLQSNMTSIGKRNATIGKYTVEVDYNGKIEKLDCNSDYDVGCSLNESPSLLANVAYPNCYDASLWKVQSQDIKTDAPGHTWCRAPGTLESIAIAETIMEHIAKVLGKDPMSVRIENMVPDSYMKTLIPNFLKDVGKCLIELS